MNQLTSRSATLKKTMVVCDTQPIAIQGMRALVAERQDEWLKDLRTALHQVEQVRAEGPHD